MAPSSVKVKQNQKQKRTHRINVSALKTSGTNERGIPNPVRNKRTNDSPMIEAGRKHKMTKPEASLKNAGISKHPWSGYDTLLDINMMNTAAPPASAVSPTEEFVPNSYHQNFHVARWTAWLRETPQWIIKLGIESLCTLSGKNCLQTPQNEPCNSNIVQMCRSKKAIGIKDVEDKNKPWEQNSEMKENVTKWRDWSLQLTDDNRLCITGKTTQNTVELSRDVSSCERIDANTLLHGNGSVYVLSGMPDHFTNLPYYVRNKFQCGFPDDWKEVKCKWVEYISQGSPYDFTWTVQTDTQVLGAASIEVSTEEETMWEDEIFRNSSSPPRMTDASPRGVPANHKGVEQSHSLALQDKVKWLNPKEKESQSTVNQEIILEKWAPVLVNGCDLKITGCIQSELHTEMHHTTDIMVKRTACDTFQSKNGKTYRLIGTLVDPDNRVPREIKKKLSKGLPAQWKMMVKTWVSLLHPVK